jgi:hypothetical protein
MRYGLYLWAFVSVPAIAVAAASCGDSSGTSHSTSTGARGGAGGHTGGGGSGMLLGGNATGGKNQGGSCAGGLTCADLGADCGAIDNGCGQLINCGATCPNAGDVCGGGGQNKCGPPTCVPLTCAEQGIACGGAGDGCGKQIDCGSCAGANEMCSGVPAQCVPQGACTPKTCAEVGANCGWVSNGCNDVMDCGSCTNPGDTCGGNKVPNVCGKPPCTPMDCATLGAACGPASDGCGTLIPSCGTCTAPQICGGGGVANQCGIPSTCTNLCLKQVSCSSPSTTTTISGTVYAPNGTDPLPNVLVYVPNGTVQDFTPGVSCDNCGDAASGSPLVSAVSGVDGKFTIKNAPVSTNVPLVIQVGRWRRKLTIANVASCVDNPLPATQTRLPRKQSEGDIPLMAFSTGQVDALECVMRKIGVDDSEFTAPTGNGRIHIYTATVQGGVSASGNGQPKDTTLVGSQTALNQYDMVLFPCQGTRSDRTTAELQNIVNYANAGGRIFTTHFSYVWLYSAASFPTTAAWHVDQDSWNSGTGYIDMTFPKGLLLAQWLFQPAIKASTTLGQIPLQVLRKDTDAVNNPPAINWITTPRNNVNVPMHMTFNTPISAPADQQCGRVVFDDFHVEDHAQTPSVKFPDECAAGAMTPQEKMLEFMLFDLASCITPDIPTCTPKTCLDQNIGCGAAGDGCNGTLDCGPCPAGQTCGGGGYPSQCGAPSCTPLTCAGQNIDCGPTGDGCGGILQCGNCPAGQTCGGGGQPGKCGANGCTATTCAAQGVECGPTGNGCGGVLQCGDCPSGQTCGGGGVPGKCGVPPCTPTTCAAKNAVCGLVPDGCGHALDCGTCPTGQVCKINNQCGLTQ